MAEMTATPVRPSPRFGVVLRAIGGIAAIGVKELRGRMRGRRAFIILTIYLLLLGGFALMVEQIMEFAGFESGRATLDVRPADLGGIIEEALRGADPLVREHHATIERRGSTELPAVLVDPSAGLEDDREERPLAQLGDAQLDVSGLSGQQPGS